MPWLITKITDLGRKEHYRWFVDGFNTEGTEIPMPFSWHVPSVADARYQPAPDADDETLRGLLVAKLICAPPPAIQSWQNMTPKEILAALVAGGPPAEPSRPCLACAREEQAAAGFPGIDRLQDGHSCGTDGYALDGEPIDLADFIHQNTDPDAPGLSAEQMEEIRHMMPGDSLLLGGGAGETFTLKRTR